MLLVGYLAKYFTSITTILSSADSMSRILVDTVMWVVPAYLVMTVIDRPFQIVKTIPRIILAFFCGVLWYLFFSFFGFR